MPFDQNLDVFIGISTVVPRIFAKLESQKLTAFLWIINFGLLRVHAKK